MDRFDLYILGCGSALPTRHHLPAAQILNVRDKLFMIDCGEGTQLQFRQTKLNYNKIYDIFISHLHGDHCFGIIGLISTMGMLGRTASLTIHAHPELEKLMRPQLDFFCKDLAFPVLFSPFNPTKSEMIYEDRSVQVFTIPLKHRIPSSGFLFRERERERHILKEMIDFYKIPLKSIPAIKAGADFITKDGDTIPNVRLTLPPTPSKSYAYCSDTAYSEKIIPLIQGVDLLFHEATFGDSELDRAKKTMHSTASQAAGIASKANVKKLMIGHFSARYVNEKGLLNEACRIFPNTVLADEGMRIEI
ncbi:MAG: ribonuclease Z [Bacteroidales bacterium]|nr:ribonuclease Z [Bacteroidales bacterium]